MTSLFTRAGRSSRSTFLTVLGVLLVPLTVATLFLWGLWNPKDRLTEVTAAVVNHDKPVTLNGKLTPLGRVLAAKLIGKTDKNFTWELTDAKDAKEGLHDGRYAARVVIPKNFSAAATSGSKGPDRVEQAHIEIDTSPRGKLLDTAISQTVADTATRVINEQLGKAFVDNIFVGMNKLSSGLKDAAGGAHRLATGGDQLADGAGKLRQGTSELANGANAYSSGVGQFTGGVNRYVDGVGALAQGADRLANGLGALDSGLAEAAGKAGQAAAGQHTLANGVTEYVDGVNRVAGPIANALPNIRQGVQELRNRIANGELPGLDDDQRKKLLADLDALLARFDSDSGAAAGLQKLIAGGEQLKQGAQEAAAGGDKLAAGLQRLSGGVHQSAGGAQQLAQGANRLRASGGELQSGANRLSDGANRLAAGANAASEGAGRFADSVPQLARGAHSLADGLDKAHREVPTYSKTERTKMATSAVTPVVADRNHDELFHDKGVPLFTAIALWAGGLAAFMALLPFWRRTNTAALSVGRLTLRSSLTGVVLGAAQGALAGAVLPATLGYDAGRYAAFFGLAVLAGVAFALMNQGLAALFGSVGKFLAFLLLVIAFVVGVVSTAPEVLQNISSVTPLGTAFSGFQAIATGQAGAGVAVAALVCWAGLGMVLLALAVNRLRKQPAEVR